MGLYVEATTPASVDHTNAALSRNPNKELFALTSNTPPRPPTPTPTRETNSQRTPSQSPRLGVPSQTAPVATAPSKHATLSNDSPFSAASESPGPWYSDASSVSYTQSTMSIFSSKATPPHQINISNVATRTISNESNDSNTTVQKLRPKSPGTSKLGSFFGWGGATSPASSVTNFSDKSALSPVPASPQPSENTFNTDAFNSTPVKAKPKHIDVPKANADKGSYFGSYLQLPQATPTSPVQVEEMEKELKEISAELAASIRREMDLEDLVERLQTEAQNPSGANRRTSDYYSDSGTSSVRYGDPDSKQDELDRMIRKTEQDKALMRVELTDKVQEERTRRKQLEGQIRQLEERASQVGGNFALPNVFANDSLQVDLVSINSLDANGRLRDLEATCEDLRRRLAEERQVKDNFEDLLSALKDELQSSHNERDNLRDEIVPQLRARVEGLEAQAAEHEQMTYEQSKLQQELQALKDESIIVPQLRAQVENLEAQAAEHEQMTYEQSRLQQELQALKKENVSLINAQKLQADLQNQMRQFNTISEDSVAPSPRTSIGLGRSNSVAHSSTARMKRPQSLMRSNSVKTSESRDALAERVKDVELQRDALHRALKSLLERQEHQNRENQKKIRLLEIERDRALTASPRRLGYGKEVANLREEINTLRRRADEAIEQKWQCEKGLSGLKMDLDRAEQEIGSLKNLLKENDVLIPSDIGESNGQRPVSGQVSSESLEQAYRDLQKAYAESLERVKSLEASGPKDEETEQAMKHLEQTLAEAISERDFAMQDAASSREVSESLREAEKSHMGEEIALADELRNSAKRVEDLAHQVKQQLASNATLRQRLAETIERGEKDQKSNAQKIMFMQSKLKSLEDHLMIAQQASEEKVARHEQEIHDLKQSHNAQLLRVKEGLQSPHAFGPKSPMSQMFANSIRAPRLMSMTVSEDSKMEFLKKRVVELENALADADRQMEEVVGRMNVAQIEVMELQNEREEAVRETRRLQKMIEEERVRAFEGQFAKLSS